MNLSPTRVNGGRPQHSPVAGLANPALFVSALTQAQSPSRTFVVWLSLSLALAAWGV